MKRGLKMRKSFLAYIERDPETGLYVGSVPEIPGAYTQLILRLKP